jgi:isoleucyl-tRNA synthetase
MSQKFKEYKELNLVKSNKEILNKWEENNCFENSIKNRDAQKSFIFNEGPPSANGKPGIHHVMGRTIKDVFCRFKTLDGYQVKRKAGWDTHGLPVELGVEKTLGITKEDIGTKISVDDYNKACREEVMKYTNLWGNLTKEMGYWVDMENPYVTYENKYIETLWNLLQKIYNKSLLYKGYTIQPFSPAAGTGLSTHELNQPGCYKDVKDTTAVAQFKIVRNETSEFLFDGDEEVHFMAWTTTPWTLPSNTALAVGPKIEYVKVKTFNPYTGVPVNVVLGKPLMESFFSSKNAELQLEDYKEGDKKIPFKQVAEYVGKDLAGIKYEQLIDWVQPIENTEGVKDAFRVITGDFVTTEDGTGIVHIAPTFGADDALVAKQSAIPPLQVLDKTGKLVPLVDQTGKFYKTSDLDAEFVKNHIRDSYKEYEGKFVKNAYDPELTEKDPTIDVHIAVMLKKENKAFKVEKHVHSYPHCWRTDKPVLYYPLDSWFIKTTAVKDRMVELNKTINWHPKSTGEGRFHNWLENLLDWNLSRERYWGTPLPIWVTEDRSETICIGSFAELKAEIDKSIEAGFMTENPLVGFVEGDFSKENYEQFDIHRPYVDSIFLVSPSGQKMTRETEIIDVWFDSGAMPFAQWHYPFENKEIIDELHPADFIAEGVDQTRGWFFTLHAISTMITDKVAFKNIISNGLLQDKHGQKMSKRLGNAIDPFECLGEHGSDAVRWYMISNSQPWDNLKFDEEGVKEVRRKFFGTLYNTYNFFALYANVDGFTYSEDTIPMNERPEIDRWIISALNSLVKQVKNCLDNYDATTAARAISSFVNDSLSNWYVRLNRKRFWGGEYDQDKISAYQTLYECLETVCVLISPISPFISDEIFTDLNKTSKKNVIDSIHLADFPNYDEAKIDKALEERIDLSRKATSMILALRRKANLKVRQPLNKILVPILNEELKNQFESVKNILLSEVNIKNIEYISDTSDILVKSIKPNFKILGKKMGKNMKEASMQISKFTNADIAEIERNGEKSITIDGSEYKLQLEEVEIMSEDIPGWLVTTEGGLTIALDISITEELLNEGYAREFVNKIQNLRKDSGFEVTDKISIQIQKHASLDKAVEIHKEYISNQTLGTDLTLVDSLENATEVEIATDITTEISIVKV